MKSPRKCFAYILMWYLLTELFPLPFLSVFIDKIFLSVNTEGILIGIKWILNKQKKKQWRVISSHNNNFIVDFLFEVIKSIIFKICTQFCNVNFFIAYFCSIFILFGCLLVLFFSLTNLLYGYMILYMLLFVLDFLKLYLFVNC